MCRLGQATWGVLQQCDQCLEAKDHWHQLRSLFDSPEVFVDNASMRLFVSFGHRKEVLDIIKRFSVFIVLLLDIVHHVTMHKYSCLLPTTILSPNLYLIPKYHVWFGDGPGQSCSTTRFLWVAFTRCQPTFVRQCLLLGSEFLSRGDSDLIWSDNSSSQILHFLMKNESKLKRDNGTTSKGYNFRCMKCCRTVELLAASHVARHRPSVLERDKQ